MKPDFQTLDEITRRLTASLPAGLQSAQAEMQQQFRTILESAFQRMDLVSREEFEIQRRVLERTREKLDGLEEKLLHKKNTDE